MVAAIASHPAPGAAVVSIRALPDAGSAFFRIVLSDDTFHGHSELDVIGKRTERAWGARCGAVQPYDDCYYLPTTTTTITTTTTTTTTTISIKMVTNSFL